MNPRFFTEGLLY